MSGCTMSGDLIQLGLMVIAAGLVLAVTTAWWPVARRAAVTRRPARRYRGTHRSASAPRGLVRGEEVSR